MGADNGYSGVLASRLQELLKARKEAGAIKNDSAVAKAIGVSSAALSNFTWGVTGISTENLIKLALYFNVSTDYLLGLDRPIRHDFNVTDASIFLGLRVGTVSSLVEAGRAGLGIKERLALSNMINNALMLCGGYYENETKKVNGFLTFDKKEAE